MSVAVIDLAEYSQTKSATEIKAILDKDIQFKVEEVLTSFWIHWIRDRLNSFTQMKQRNT